MVLPVVLGKITGGGELTEFREVYPVWASDLSIWIIRSQMPSTSICTPGVLFFGDYFHSVTLELPWRDNKTNISCIPAGSYPLRLKDSAKFGQSVEVFNVPDRSEILFHAGNSDKDTHGCILLGTSYQPGSKMIQQSRDAVLRFKQCIKDSIKNDPADHNKPFRDLGIKLHIGTFEEIVEIKSQLKLSSSK